MLPANTNELAELTLTVLFAKAFSRLTAKGMWSDVGDPNYMRLLREWRLQLEVSIEDYIQKNINLPEDPESGVDLSEADFKGF